MMFNTQHQVVPVESAEELADALVEVVDGKTSARSLCLCVGFYYQGYLWLNDSRVPDAIHFHQEQGVVKSEEMYIQGLAHQVESITISWPTRDELVKIIEKVAAGAYDDEGWPTFVCTEPAENHICDQCR